MVRRTCRAGVVLALVASTVIACSFDLAAVDLDAGPGNDSGVLDVTSGGDDGATDSSQGDDGPVTGGDAGSDGPADAGSDVVSADVAPDTPLDAGPTRVTAGLIVLYTMLEGAGATVHDVSGVAPALDLTIGDLSHVTWIAGGGLRFNTPTVAASPGPAAKVTQRCKASNAITMEAWITPANRNQGAPSARFLAISTNTGTTSADIAQVGSRFGGSLLTTTGQATFDMPGNVDLQLTHFVITREAGGAWVGYIDGKAQKNGSIGGDLTVWNDSLPIALANTPALDRAWLGTIHLTAVYERALTAQEVLLNYTVGP